MTTGLITSGSPSNSPAYRYKSWSGGNDPKKIIPQPYTMRLKEQNCELSKVYDNNGFVTQGYFQSNLTNAPPLTSYQESQLSQKLYEAIKSHDFDLGVFAAESLESLELLKKTGLGVFNFLKQIKRGRPDLAMRVIGATLSQKDTKLLTSRLKSGDISGTVLALKYGWLPLLQDAYAASRYLEQRFKARELRYSVSLTIPSKWIDTMNGTSPVRASGHRTVRLTAILKEDISTYRSLGLTDPSSIIWELLPWSFVWDWFNPIGSYLAQAALFGGLSGTFVRTDFATAYGIMNVIPQPSKPQYRIGGMVTYRVVSLDRTVNLSYVPPLPGFKPIDKALGLSHIVSAVALFHQLRFR